MSPSLSLFLSCSERAIVSALSPRRVSRLIPALQVCADSSSTNTVSICWTTINSKKLTFYLLFLAKPQLALQHSPSPFLPCLEHAIVSALSPRWVSRLIPAPPVSASSSSSKTCSESPLPAAHMRASLPWSEHDARPPLPPCCNKQCSRKL